MMANRFKQAAPNAKKLYKTGRYPTFAAAMKAALKKTPKRVGAIKMIERGESRHTPAKKVYRVTRTKAGRFKNVDTISGLLSKAKGIIKEKIDTQVIKKYHATGKRAKRKIQRHITELKSKLRKLA